MFKSLKFKVVATFIGFVIIPVLIGAAIILTQIQATQLSQLEIMHNQMTKRVASEFENYVNYNISQLVQMVQMNDIPINNLDAASEKLMSEIMFNNNFDQIFLLNAKGVELVHVHRYKISNTNEHKDYSGTIEYLFPKLNRTVFYGDVKFIEEIGEPIMDISFDIREPQTNELKGVIIASLRLKPIWNLLANIYVQPGQQVYILDSKNRLVAHPNPSMVLKNIKFKLPTESITTGLMGNRVFMKYFKINFGNQFFTIVSEHNLKDAFKLHRSISIVVYCVIASTIIMSLLLIVIMMRFVVNPINHLSRVAKEIENGNLDSRAVVTTDDEIGALAAAFNKMTKKLKDNTIQLQEFNIGLQKKIKHEIEKTRRMEQMLFEQKKFADMGQMINAIAHQWRQPLNNIGLIQQYLYDGFVNGDITTAEYKDLSNSLMEIVQGMSGTIDDFRTFFTSKKVKEKFNVIMSIKEFMKLTSAQLTSSNIKYQVKCFCCEENHSFDENTVFFNCDNKKLEILGHSGEFKQVLQNIVANAKDAFIEKEIRNPFLDVNIKMKGNNVEISFRDNAGGIPEDVMPNIFDPYFTTKPEGKGTGIGLYISKVIIDDHFGGRLFAKNTVDGAEFIIMIPICNS